MEGFLKYSNTMIDDTEAKAADFRKYLKRGGSYE